MISKKKFISAILAISIVAALAVGGTLAYLTAKTDAVTNTFTVGNVNVALAETKTDFKMVPNTEIDKDPKVSVTADSEDSYVFVKVEKSANLDTYINYTIAEGWSALNETTYPGVYYREFTSGTDQTWSVLTGDKVAVKDTVKTSDMAALAAEGATQPTLTFTAYAVQKDGVSSAEQAWTIAQNNGTLPSGE